ncbi:MAG: amino acid racemase [Thermoplasmata archaeon]|nr:amino acid racemase [Thermoplasmata archaeon]
MRKKFIGVLGGMGPDSSILFYRMLIEQCRKQYGARYDHDFPKILIYNLPTPGGIEGTMQARHELLGVLIEGAGYLQSCGIDFIVMPCNSTHCFIKEMRNSVSIPILSIVEEAAKKVRSKGYKKVGLLATKACVENRIYDDIFGKNGISLTLPDERAQDKITEVIWNVYDSKNLEGSKKALRHVVEELKIKGAHGVILGCTELPILLKECPGVELFDTVEILAESTIRYAVEQ